MPILNVGQSKSVIVLTRSTMLFYDARKSVTEVAEELKAL